MEVASGSPHMARYEEHKLRNYSSLHSATIQRAIASITLPTTPYKKKKSITRTSKIPLSDSRMLQSTFQFLPAIPLTTASLTLTRIFSREKGRGEGLQMKFCAIGILPSWKNAGYQRAEQYVKGYRINRIREESEAIAGKMQFKSAMILTIDRKFRL